MKALSFITTLFFLSTSAFAQLDKSSWLVGGDMAYSSSKVASITTSTFNFSPNVGYFLIDKLAGGVRGIFQSSKVSGADAINYNNIGPFLRYYLLEKSGKANLFVDGNFVFGSSTALGSSVNHTGYGFAAGPAFFLNKHAALEVQVGYQASKEQNNDVWTNAFKMGVGLQIHLEPGK